MSLYFLFLFHAMEIIILKKRLTRLNNLPFRQTIVFSVNKFYKTKLDDYMEQ